MKPSEWVEKVAEEIVRKMGIRPLDAQEVIEDIILDTLWEDGFYLAKRDKEP
jgi:hypothetical protein